MSQIDAQHLTGRERRRTAPGRVDGLNTSDHLLTGASLGSEARERCRAARYAIRKARDDADRDLPLGACDITYADADPGPLAPAGGGGRG